MRHYLFRGLVSLAALASGIGMIQASESAQGTIAQPLPRAVFQRQGFLPTKAHENQAGGPELGFAMVPVAADLPAPAGSQLEFRIVPLAGAFGRGTNWTKFNARSAEGKIFGEVKVPAGGWYRLELRSSQGGRVIAQAAMEPFGVGEVFLIAGQSYACGHNDQLMPIEDPQERTVSWDSGKQAWAVANDPQPGVDGGYGTIWPCMANALLPVARVPIGFVNVAVGGTASRQWLPGEKLFQNMVRQAKCAGNFRAVLWQQGESDVIEKVGTAQYVQNLMAIRQALAKELGFDPPWLLAKSTLHPTVYNTPEGEGQIRAAIEQLCRVPGFRPGPDTDILGGENRGGAGSRRHFTGLGQQRAGLLWFAAIWSELNR